VLAGENEIRMQKVTLKNMEAGTQEVINAEELIKILSA
jgi:histidyl-tRNA synthetase